MPIIPKEEVEMKVICANAEEAVSLAKRMFFLAYEACGGPVGMGFFQAREGITEEQVWQNVCIEGDYTANFRGSNEKRPYGDYVFGRMMKWGCNLNDATAEVRQEKFRPDYQGFSRIYRTPEDLVSAAIASLNIQPQIISG